METQPYQPFMGPELRPGLEGQRYDVLRPAGEMERIYKEVQAKLLGELGGQPVTHPLEPHVVVGSHPSGRVEELSDVVGTWAVETPPVELEVDLLTTFPDPYRIVIFQIKKTPKLVQAFSRLVRAGRSRGLPEWPEGVRRTAEEWVFHMSVLYCSELGDEEWRGLVQRVATIDPSPTRFRATSAELVTYDQLQERSQTYGLQGSEA